MKTPEVIQALHALAQQHRLAVFRLLVERGSAGLSAGRIAERLQLAPSSLTFHLQNLQRAGLIRQRREGRQLFYSADFVAMNGLVGYLTDHCCSESGESCAPGCQPIKLVQSARRRSRAA